MDFLKKAEFNSIIIIPYNLKDKILDYINENNISHNFKIMTLNDLKKGLLFDYENKAIGYIMNKKKVNYGIAKNYLNNLYYLEDKRCDNEKWLFLKDLYQELVENDLIIKDSLFISLLKSKTKLYVFGFDYLKKFDLYLLDLAKNYIDVDILKKEYKKDEIKEVNSFLNINEEISFVAEKIADLIIKGVDINKIYIANYNDSYFFTLNYIFKSFNIPFYIKGETNIYETGIGSYFLRHLNNNFDQLLYKIHKHFNCRENSFNMRVYEKLSSLLNKYYWCDNINDYKDLIIEEMKKTKIKNNHFKCEIKTTDILNNYFNDDEHVFLINFNLGSIPVIKKDEDYLSDDIKPDFLEKTNEYNKMIKDAYIKAITNIKNITITYKNHDNFDEYYPSFLVNDKHFEVFKNEYTISNHNNTLNKITMAKKIDKLLKFNEQSNTLNILNNNYQIPYQEYDNRFSGMENENFIAKIKDSISFSYSNISEYYKCPFKFYLGSILGIKEYEQKLYQFIGSLFHHTLEVCLNDKKRDINTTYDEYINNYPYKDNFTNKDYFFINMLKKEVSFLITTIREQYKHSSHENEWHEKRIEVEFNRKIRTKFSGIVDKVLLLDKYALIIDYKTSNTEINKDLFNFGVDIQLPIYLYLLKQVDKDIEVAGMYLQHILDLDSNYEKDKDLIEEKRKKLKLAGITFNNIDLISKFDDSYEKSEVISKLKIKKDTKELAINSSIMSDEEKDELIKLIEGLIINAIDKCLDADFQINPLKIETKVDGCKFCDYKDICYRKPKDFNYQTIDKGSDIDESN